MENAEVSKKMLEFTINIFFITLCYKSIQFERLLASIFEIPKKMISSKFAGFPMVLKEKWLTSTNI